MAANQFTKIVNIDINTSSIEDLDKHLKEVNDEINKIKTSELSLNQSLAEQAATVAKLNALDAERNKTIDAKNNLLEVSLTETEKLAKAEKKAEADKKKADEDSKKRDEVAIKRADDFKKAGEGIAGSFTVAASASLLFGGKTGEALAEAQAKVVGLVAGLDGAKKVVEGSVAGYKLLQEGIQKSTVLSKIFGTTTKTAIVSTGIGVLVVALGLVFAYFTEITEAAKQFAKELGLTDVIDNLDKVSESIGGISGVLTIIGGVVKGFVKEIVNYYTALYKIFTLDFKGAVENVKKIGSAIKDETVKAVKEAEIAAAVEREKARKESLVKLNQQEIDLLKAQGKNTLALEKETIDLRIDLLNYRLSKVKAGSEEEKKIQEELNKELVNVETNKKAQADKFFDDRLKKIQSDYNKQQKLLVDANTTEEEFAQKSYANQLKLVTDEIALRKKRNEDVAALELQKSTLTETETKRREDKAKADAEKAQQDALDALDKQLIDEQIKLQEKFASGVGSEQEYQEALLDLDETFLKKRLTLVKAGSQEEAELKKQINENSVNDRKKTLQEEADLDKYYADLEVSNLNKVKDNTKNTYKERKQAATELRDKEKADIEQRQAELETAGKTETVEYQKNKERLKQIDKDYSNFLKDLNLKRIEDIKKVSDTAFQFANEVSGLLSSLEQNQIDAANARIEEFEARNEEINEKIEESKTAIEENNKLIEESTSKIDELEANLSNARGARAEVIKQQIENEKKNREDLLKQNDKLGKQQKELANSEIANQKRIDKEKDKIAELELQRKRREKVLALAQAAINVALGISQAVAQGGVAGIATGAIVAAFGAIQIATIASQKLKDGGVINEVTGGVAVGASHAQGGIKVLGGRTEIEGGEYVVNKESTKRYLPLLHAINGNRVQERNDFMAQGGVTDFSNINSIQQTSNDALNRLSETPIQVAVTEINEKQRKVEVIENSGTF